MKNVYFLLLISKEKKNSLCRVLWNVWLEDEFNEIYLSQ